MYNNEIYSISVGQTIEEGRYFYKVSDTNSPLNFITLEDLYAAVLIDGMTLEEVFDTGNVEIIV
ncbi:hypothetical protein [Cohnella fermenti]|uniref:Uncharacterized protein n=1 Tax=Cohnella fermenti TaxID=2565925 RepID=A0A4S4C2E2_9BACL|nr:hypothetical protein [Cohnella fermenti]THF81294.1 hypothetical protein E6C55_09295 [Cohnella fermenti]